MRFPKSLAVACALLLLLPGTSKRLAAQSTVTGAVSGMVLDDRGSALPRALVSLVAVGGGGERSVATGSDGRFSIPQVPPGAYEVRIEAVGYRPLVARGLTLGGGDMRNVTFRLTASAPPVVTVDTMMIGGGSALITSGRGEQLEARRLGAFPHRLGDLAWIASLTSAFDESLGTQGLPGDLTAVVLDGLPVYRAPHPVARSELAPSALLPAAVLSSVSTLRAPTDVEWAGGVGGYVVAATPSSAPEGGLAAHAAYSGEPGWSSSRLDISAPSLHSLEGGLVGGTTSANGATRLLFAADVLRHQTPLVPRGTEELVGGLTGITPEIAEALSTPGVETYARYSGLARLDLTTGDATTLFFRGAGSFVGREYDAAGPIALGPGAAPPEESLDLSIGGGVLSSYSTNLTLEVRAGFSGSFRDFEPADGGVAPAFLSQPGVAFGEASAAVGSSSRTDMVLTPVAHVRTRFGRIKLGGALRASNHTMDHARASGGRFAFSDPAAVNAGEGFGLVTSAGEVSFSTQEYGAFAQLSASPAPGMELIVGARYDYERIPSGDLSANDEWLAATGLDNTDVASFFHQVGARASLVWEPSPTAGTRLTASVSVDRGDVDPRALHEVLSQETDPTTTRYAGAGIAWPSGELPAGATALPNIALLGPATRPPRTIAWGVGVSQRVAEGLSLHVRGSLRRTDFLLRRRNLNLPVVPRASDADGRPILGTLEKLGGLVVTTADDARRFPSFAEAWALDPDGWSKHQGLTAGLTYGGGPVDLFAAYTWSETTDNWIGAASGLPEAVLPPGLPASADEVEWAEGPSDFDVPHRIAGGARIALGRVAVMGTYRYRSGLPFTPGYRFGVDANGDGSMHNDVAFVPGDSQLTLLLDDWPCLEDQAATFAARNSCRGPSRHTLDVGIEVGLGRLGGRQASIRLDALDLVEDEGGVLDDALWHVDPAAPLATSPDGETVTIPMTLNPDFGTVLYPGSRGRMLRLGVRIGG